MNDQRIPLTLLTGFLGAGKTTLLNEVLADASAGRVAVIVNEFGEAGLDHDLMEQSSEEVILMQSGCLCCSIRGDLSNTISSLVGRKNRKEIEFDRLLIETTGLADPGPITQTLLVDAILARTTVLDGIVTVADAANGPKTLDAQFEAVSQVAMADLIIVSKTDLITAAEAESFQSRLRTLNPSAKLIESHKGRGTSNHLWNLNALKPKSTKPDVVKWTLGEAPKLDPLENISGFAPAQKLSLPTSNHDNRIGSASIVLDSPIKDTTFDLWLDTLIAMRGKDILRVKGVVFIEGVEKPFVFHGVQDIFDPPVLLEDWPKTDTQSRIVIIGRDLSDSQLQSTLDMLRAPHDDKAPNFKFINP